MTARPHRLCRSLRLRLSSGASRALALLIALILLGSVWGRHAVAQAVNIAPTAPYEISPAPNYAQAGGDPRKALNDEKRGSGRIWTGPDAIGWYHKSPIVYRQSFRSPQTIGRVEIGTVEAARSDIALPANAFVYVAGRDGSWINVGDAAASAPPNAQGQQTLSLDFPPVTTQAVAIVLYRDNSYLFLDEVRILSAPGARAQPPGTGVGNLVADAQVRRRIFAETRQETRPIGRDPWKRTAWPLPPAAAGGARCRITQIAPWTESEPSQLAAAAPYAAATPSAVGGWLTGAVRLENPTASTITVSLSGDGHDGADAVAAKVAHYVVGFDYRWRADVLAPADEVVLPPGSMTLLVLRARVTAAGDVRSSLAIDCGGERQSVTLAGRAIPIEPSDRPYGNAWSYLLGPSRNLARCRSPIHEEAWIDTAVVESAALLPRGNTLNDARLRNYLRTFAGSRRLLLFMSLTESAWATGTTELDQQLAAWWDIVSRAIREEDYRGEVLLYPLDEVAASAIPRLEAAIRAFARISPGTAVYATIDNPAALRVAGLGVRQFHDRLIDQLPSGAALGRSPQLYATLPSAKTLPLDGYYRRLGWLALAAGLDGAGVWSMWESSGADQPSSGWSDFGGIERDFALVYSDASGCPMASRRLLAFQRGLEDFAVMNACRRRAVLDVRSFARTAAQVPQWHRIRTAPRTEPMPRLDEAIGQLAQRCFEVKP